MDKDGNDRVTLDEFKQCMSNSRSWSARCDSQSDITTWMNHIGNERDIGSKTDLTAHLPFYVHHNLSVGEGVEVEA